MRDYEFRAFDKIANRMIYFDFNYIWQHGIDNSNNSYKNFDLLKYPIMQYSELLDKNRNKIYELDIVKVTNYHYKDDSVFADMIDNEFINIVRFDRGKWKVGDYPLFCIYELRYCIEVIGNEHENPELLNILED